jgi:hypothetical protein
VIGTVSQVIRRWVRRGLRRARERGAKAVVRAVRLTGAAVAAYLVAELLYPGTKPLLAPLTALLVVQVTLFSTVKTSVQRIASVVSGVLLALFFSNIFHFHWWSLAVLIAASIMIGQLLHLREQMLEVPISAMLVLAVGGADASAVGRITATLVGAAVGVLYNLVLPGPVQSRTAGEAVESFADDVARLLRQMAEQLSSRGLSEETAARWLDRTRSLARQVSRVDRALNHAEESRKLNVRALGTMDTGPSLRSGLDALEHSVVALRSLCRAIVDQIRAAPEGSEGYSPDVRDVFAVLFTDLAEAVSAFGRLVHAEAESVADPDKRALATALDTVREARVRLTDLLLLDPAGDPESWALNGTLLASVERVLREIDVEERLRQRTRRRREWEERTTAAVAVDRLRATSRQVARLPVRRQQPPETEAQD